MIEFKAMSHFSKRTAMVSMAAAAGLAGAGFAWWQHQLVEPVDDALSALWLLELELPQGGTLLLKSLRGKPIVLNFWATWCPPCIEELPLLERFYKQNAAKGWQVVGLAVDNVKAVKQFLIKMPLSFPVPLAGLAGTELSRSLGNLSGGLPFTVVLNASGKVALRHMGKLNAQQLDEFALIV
jgi:thiol-disulfide isomerase/thioredoxin